MLSENKFCDKGDTRMKNVQKDYMFNYFISGMDKKMQATLNMMYMNSMKIDEMNHQREMGQMKKGITEDVMSRVSIQLEDKALRELRDLLNDIGN